MFVLTGFVAYNLAAWFANDSYDKELLNAAHAVAARLTEDRKGIVADLPDAVQAVLKHNDTDNFFYQILNTDKVRLAGDAILPMPLHDVNTDIPAFRNAVVNGHDVRIARDPECREGGGRGECDNRRRAANPDLCRHAEGGVGTMNP